MSTRGISSALDQLLTVLKWPSAIAFLLLAPGSLAALVGLVGDVAHRPDPLLPFLGGVVTYLIAWYLLFRRPVMGSLVSTFEHELTHAVFAWLTFHRVTGLRASWKEGGEVRFRGRGNWLIIIGPYFFPTLSVALALVLALIPDGWLAWATALLGVTVAYHTTSTWRETHRQQPDLERVGFPFAFAFLPAANILSYGLLIAFAYGGLTHVGRFAERLSSATGSWLGWIF